MGADQTGSPSWSPDGTLVLFDSTAEGNFEVYTIDARGGNPRRLTNHHASDAVASFSRDGRWIYFDSNRSGRTEIWKMPAAGGDAIRVTRNLGHGARESPDGQYLYFTGRRSPADEVFILYRIAVAGGEAQRITEYPWLNAFAVTTGGVYIGRKDSIELLDPSTNKRTKLADVSGGLNWYLSASPDERYLLYTLNDRKGSDLLLVENFH
jgi:Tol biopolymer transport system component